MATASALNRHYTDKLSKAQIRRWMLFFSRCNIKNRREYCRMKEQRWCYHQIPLGRWLILGVPILLRKMNNFFRIRTFFALCKKVYGPNHQKMASSLDIQLRLRVVQARAVTVEFRQTGIVDKGVLSRVCVSILRKSTWIIILSTSC